MADLTINLAVAGSEVVTGALRRVGEVAINALGAALGKVADFAADSFKGALEAQKGMDALSASITRLGSNAPVTMAGAQELAESFKDLVGGSDDAVLAMVNMGLRFDKISADTFPQFIQQSADLAAVLGTDPVKASEILGKALQDLSVDGEGSIGRLKAAGVAFTQAQEDQIKAMVAAGDVAGAQKILLDALAETTGGAAAAAAGTMAGQMTILQETIADAGESVMLALMPTLMALAEEVIPLVLPAIASIAAFATEFITNTLVPAFQTAVAWVRENWPAIQAAIADMWTQAHPVLQAVSDFIQTVVIPAFNQAVQWVVTNWPTIYATIQTVLSRVQAFIQQVMGAIQAFWAEWGDEIMTVAAGVFKYVEGIVRAFSAALRGDWRGMGEALRSSWNVLWQGIQDTVSAAVAWFGQQDWGAIGTAILQGIANGITSAVGFVVSAAQQAASAAFEAAKGFLGIQSPSKLFAGIGGNMMLGMAQGITAGIAEPVGAARSAAAAVTNSVTNNSGGNTYNYYGVQADMNYAYARAVAGAMG